MAKFEEAFYQRSGGLVPVGQIGGNRIALGSILAFDDGHWSHVSTVNKKFGLTVKALPPQAATTNSYSGSGGKGFSFKAYAKGSPGRLITNVADAKARAEVIFKASDAYMFAVQNQSMRTLGNLEQLYAAIQLAYHLGDVLPPEKQWHQNYAVVVSVASAKSVVISLAQSKNASLVISGSGSAGPPATVADVSARMSFELTTESLFNSAEAPSNGFAFQLARINPKSFRVWSRDRTAGQAFAVRDMRAFNRNVAGVSEPTMGDLVGRVWSAAPPDGNLPADGFQLATPRGGVGRNLPASVRLAARTPASKRTTKAASKRTANKARTKKVAAKKVATKKLATKKLAAKRR
jgi:hypothetical protein